MGVAPSLQVLRRDLHRHRHGQGRRLLRQGNQLDFQQGLYVGEDLDVFQQFDGKAGRLAPDVAQGKGCSAPGACPAAGAGVGMAMGAVFPLSSDVRRASRTCLPPGAFCVTATAAPWTGSWAREV